MTNAPHILETALLLLAAFMIGAFIGLFARARIFRKARPAATATETANSAVPAEAQLVTAPAIAPLPAAPRPTAAQRLAAAARPSRDDDVPLMPAVRMPTMPELPGIEPARMAGETLSGRQLDNPERKPAEPMPAADAGPTPASLSEVRTDLEEKLAAALPAAVTVETATDAGVERLPVEERKEPELEAEPVVLLDAPEEVAAEIQDVIETPDGDPVPDVVAEAPLVEPSYLVEAEEAGESIDAELAAMRAIEGGWRPRGGAARKPADLPEGVSPAEIRAARDAVAASGEAVASATATATAVLEQMAPARGPRPGGGFGKPQGLAAPRQGAKDNLSQIKGLGPAIESSLNGLGIYHYDQIAGWDPKAVTWIENHFGFKGRIARERWQEQARDLGRGRSTTARPVRR